MTSEQQQASPGYKIWLKADATGNTPIHVVTPKTSLVLSQFLIDLIQQEADPAHWINKENPAGDTPLHRTFAADGLSIRNKLLDKLLAAKADVAHLNHAGRSPFDLLCTWSAEKQLVFLRVCEHTEQVLSLYKAHLAAHPKMVLAYFNDHGNDPSGRTAAMQAHPIVYAYFTAQSDSSLKDRCIAALELDPLVEPKSTYVSVIREEDDDVLIPPYKTKTVQRSITSDAIEDKELSKRLPLFSERLLATQGLFAFSHNKLVQNEFLLKQDRALLDQTIRQVNQLLTDLSSRVQAPTKKHKITAVVVPVLAWSLYVAGTAFLVTRAIQAGEAPPIAFSYYDKPILGPEATEHPNSRHYDCLKEKIDGHDRYRVYTHYSQSTGDRRWNEYTDCELTYSSTYGLYKWFSVGIALGGAVVNGVISCCVPLSLWNKQDPFMIEKQTWQAVLIALQDIHAKLSALPDADLPVQRSTVATLTEQLATLQDDKLRDEAVTAFTNLERTLRILQSDLAMTRKPFSTLDKRDVVIEVEKESGEDVALLDGDAAPMRSLAPSWQR